MIKEVLSHDFWVYNVVNHPDIIGYSNRIFVVVNVVGSPRRAVIYPGQGFGGRSASAGGFYV